MDSLAANDRDREIGRSELKILDDGSILASGKVPEQETYTLVADLDRPGITGIRLEAMPDPSLPAHGPGRASNGNFVLSEFTIATSPKAGSDKPTKITLQHASADFSQSGYDVARAIDGKPATGWAILPETGKPHVAIFETKSAIRAKRVEADDLA